MPKTVGPLLYPRWLSSWKTLSILTTELPAQFWGFLNFGQDKSFFTCPWCKIRNVQNPTNFISRGAYVDARSSAFRTQNLDEEIHHPLFLAFKRCRLQITNHFHVKSLKTIWFLGPQSRFEDQNNWWCAIGHSDDCLTFEKHLNKLAIGPVDLCAIQYTSFAGLSFWWVKRT